MSDGNRFLKGFFSAGSDVLSAKAEAQARQDEIRATGAENWKRTVYETESRRQEQELARQHDFEIKKMEAGEKTKNMEQALSMLNTAFEDGTQPSNSPVQSVPSAPQQAYDHPDAPAVRQYASNVGLDENLALYALNKESPKSNPMAVSPKGAEGPMQVMPKTQEDPGYGVTPAKDSSREELRRIGVEYLNAMKEKYGDDKLALIAYNFGPGNTDKWLKETGGDVTKLPQETQDYIADYGNQKKSVADKIQQVSTRLTSGDIRKNMQDLYSKKGKMAKNEAALKVAGLAVDLQSPVQTQIDSQNLEYEAAKKSEEATLKARQEFTESIEKKAKGDKGGTAVLNNPFYSKSNGALYSDISDGAKADYDSNARLADDILNIALLQSPEGNPKAMQSDVVDLLQEFNTIKVLDLQLNSPTVSGAKGSTIKLDPKVYQTKVDNANKNISMIGKSLGLSDDQLEEIRNELVPNAGLPSPEEEAALAQQMNPPAPEPQAAPSSERVTVVSPDGKVGTIPASKLEGALKAGFKQQ